MRLVHLLSISSLVWLLYYMYVYILYLFERKKYYSYCAKLLTIIFPIFLMVCSDISEASH